LELLEYDYTVEHRKGALHHVPDALSRAFEGESEVIVSAVVRPEDRPETDDAWYRKRFEEVASDPKRVTHWRIVDGQLYFLRPKPVVSDIVEDL